LTLVRLRATKQIRAFSEERDWTQFHDPKSLTLALVGKVGELAELLQWLPANEAAERIAHEPLRQRMAEEMSDVLTYLLRLADVAGVDLAVAASAKLSDSEGRFARITPNRRSRIECGTSVLGRRQQRVNWKHPGRGVISGPR